MKNRKVLSLALCTILVLSLLTCSMATALGDDTVTLRFSC